MSGNFETLCDEVKEIKHQQFATQGTLGEIKATCAYILEQCKKTNGRVDKLEDEKNAIRTLIDGLKGSSDGGAATSSRWNQNLGLLVGVFGMITAIVALFLRK